MFYLKKIINGRMNVPEPEYYTANVAIEEGQALVLSSGKLALADANKPTYIAMADAAANAVCPVMKVMPNMVFETKSAGAVTLGTKYPLADSATIGTGTSNTFATVVGAYPDNVVHVIFE